MFPLVSIALATYNGEKFLSQQMDSLLLQDYPNLEIVISDDCSQDATWEILQKYAQKDSRIRLLPRDKNIGYVKNFIRVFRACKGELISPCDQDDIWYPNKVQRLVEEIGNAALIYCNNQLVNINNEPLGQFSDFVNFMLSGNDGRLWLFRNTASGHAMLFRRELLYSMENVVLEKVPFIDWLIAYIAAENSGVKYLDEVLVDWRQHSDSTSFDERLSQKQYIRQKRLRTSEAILEAFAQIPSKHQDDAKKALIAWRKWLNSYFDLSLYIFCVRYGGVFSKTLKSKKLYLKYFLGYKLKKILRPNYY